MSIVTSIRSALERIQDATLDLAPQIEEEGLIWPQSDDERVWPDWLSGPLPLVQIGGPPTDLPVIHLPDLPGVPHEPQEPAPAPFEASPQSQSPARRPNRDPRAGRHEPVIIDPWPGKPSQTDPKGWSSSGIETLAWYVSFHYSRRAWGIFVRASGIDRVAGVFHAGGLTGNEASRAGLEFLLRHELGHFQTSLLTAGLELAANEAFFIRGRSTQKSRPGGPNSQPLGYAFDEEALCNALALESSPTGPARAKLRAWMDTAPAGYKDFRLHSRDRRQNSWNMVIGDVVLQRDLEWVAVPTLRRAIQAEVPVYIVADTHYDPSSIASAFLGSINVTAETASFQKDLKKANLNVLWRKCRGKLAAGNLTAVHLERLGGGPARYSAQLSEAARVGLVRRDSEWTAVLADSDHDRFYRRFEAMSV